MCVTELEVLSRRKKIKITIYNCTDCVLLRSTGEPIRVVRAPPFVSKSYNNCADHLRLFTYPKTLNPKP